MPKSLDEQIRNKCIYFNGLMNKTCDAGVAYDDAKSESEGGVRHRLPCFKDAEQPGECDFCEYPTDEYVQNRIREIDEAFDRTVGARNAIVEHLTETKADLSVNQAGVIECPACKNELHFSRAAINGHIHARCKTPGCASWME